MTLVGISSASPLAWFKEQHYEKVGEDFERCIRATGNFTRVWVRVVVPQGLYLLLDFCIKIYLDEYAYV